MNLHLGKKKAECRLYDINFVAPDKQELILNAAVELYNFIQFYIMSQI